MLTIYHNARLFLDSEYGGNLRTALLKREPIAIAWTDLEAVARMDDSGFSNPQDALDRAYALTQSVNWDWAENEGITALNKTETRSTSMGDVIEIDGEFWVVAIIGFDQCIIS
jgi:hypothetical protein